MSSVETDSNIRLLFVGILVLISGIATTALFENFAYAETESTDDKPTVKEDALEALEQARVAIAEDPGIESTENTTETVDAGSTGETGATGTTEDTTETVDAGSTGETGATGTTEDTTETVAEENERMQQAYTDEEKNTREATKKALEDSSSTGTTDTGTTDTGTTDTGTTDTGTTDTGTTDTGTTDTGTIEDVVPEEPVKKEINIYVDNIEDSPSGQMVYIKGDGAVESQKVVITILGDGNQEIVELSIFSTSSGEFSTIWIVGSDLGDGTYTLKAADPSSQAETTVTITGTNFVTKKVDVGPISENAETLAGGGGEVVIDDTTGDSQIGSGFLYDKQFKDQLQALEDLIAFIQGLLASLTTSVEGLQTQLNDETTARQGADDLLQSQVDVLAAKTPILTVSQQSVIITIPSGQQSSNTITCPAGDIAQGGGIEKLTTFVSYIETYANYMQGTDSWFFQASNTHPTDSLNVKLFINCLNIDYSPTIILSSNTNP